MASWRMAPCRFGGICCPQYSKQRRGQYWRWKQHVASKRWHTSKKFRRVAFHKKAVLLFLFLLGDLVQAFLHLSTVGSCLCPSQFCLVWSTLIFVLVLNSEFLSLYNILCSMLYTFYIISYCDFPGTPVFLMHLLIRHPFLPCACPYPAHLPALCISLILHPFLPCASPYPAPFPALCISLSCTSSCLMHPYPAPLPFCYPFHKCPFSIRTSVDVTLKRIVFACQLACTAHNLCIRSAQSCHLCKYVRTYPMETALQYHIQTDSHV